MAIGKRILNYKQRCYIEYAFNSGVSRLEICKHIGMSSLELENELRSGKTADGKYSADKAQIRMRH